MPAGDVAHEQIEDILAGLRTALEVLRARPVKPGGVKLTIHIAGDWRDAFIELPPEVIKLRPGRR